MTSVEFEADGPGERGAVQSWTISLLQSRSDRMQSSERRGFSATRDGDSGAAWWRGAVRLADELGIV